MDGHIYTGRSTPYLEEHVFDQDTLSVCLIGNFDVVDPSGKQMYTLYRFLEEKIREYDVAISSVLGHRELYPETCPGKNIDMDEIRDHLSSMNIASASMK